MAKIQDFWIRIIGVPVAALNSPYLYTELASTNRFGFWVLYLIAIAQVGLIWEVNRIFIKIARKKYAELSQTRQRIIYQFVSCCLTSISLQIVYLLIHNSLPKWRVVFSQERYWATFIVSVFVLVAIITIYEAFYFYRKLREKREETARLKKEQVERQLESLKAQINPHFLFNSLNTLSSLISVDADKANQFLEEMATVYRYLLRNNDVALCSLADELQFIRAYFHLIKTRYGKGVVLYIEVEEQYLKCQIPPLTLQLLIENAVKHNIVSLSKPLIIKIYTAPFPHSLKTDTSGGGNLVVANNLQKKKIAVASTKVGLSNIIEKYALLNQNAIEVIQDDSEFRVTLPLIG